MRSTGVGSGDGSSQSLARVYRAQLETGEKMIYLASEPITRKEAGKRIREKFKRGGKFIK